MLHKFKNELTAGSGDGATSAPPFVIRARDLDGNFSKCYPVPTDGGGFAYDVVRSSDEGYRLVGRKIFDVCENGKAVKYRFFAERLPDL
jgi:hypothetical protein